MPWTLLASAVAAAVFVAATVAPRHARADDVTTSVSRGTLKIKGDAASNKLTLDQDGLGATEVRITGDPTTIDGAPGPLVVPAVTAGMQIDLGDGDDELDLEALTIADAVKIKMGAGNDILSINSGTFGDAVSLDLGKGDNSLALCEGTITGALSIKVGAGDGAANSLILCGTTGLSAHGTGIVIAGLDVGDRFILKGSTANESVALYGAKLGDDAKLALGGGTDALSVCATDVTGTLAVQMGKGVPGTDATASCDGPGNPVGENALDLEGGTIGQDFTLRMGASDDSVLVSMNPIDETAKLDLGQGANILVLDGHVGQSLSVKSGGNGDLVQIKDATIGEHATVSAGAGNNDVAFFSTTVGEKLLVKTGNGDDTIDTSGATAGVSKTIRNGRGNDTVVK